MKRMIMSLVLAASGLFPSVSQAFICSWKDLGCFAPWILPFSQTGSSIKEWSAVSGSVKGSGYMIEIKLRFDNESVSTLGYAPNWYSPQNVFFKKFGLEVDLCDPSNTLRFDRIDSTFPANARASRDISTLDSTNKCTNAIGLLVQDAGYIQANVDYFVYIYLQDQLPANGVVVTPSLQISADTRLLLYAAGITGEYLFDGTLLGDYLDKFDFFAIESDNYSTGWKLYQDGHQGLCWTSKSASAPCSTSPPSPPDPQAVPAVDDPGNRMLAVTTLPSAAGSPATLPDFMINKFWVEDDSGKKVKIFYPGQHHTTKGQVKNRGNANSPSAITVKYYLSNGRKVDTNKQEVGSDVIQASSLTVGSTHTESIGLNAPMTPGTYNYIVCADTGNAVTEKHESNNCSDELIFEVVPKTDWLVPILNLLLND